MQGLPSHSEVVWAVDLRDLIRTHGLLRRRLYSTEDVAVVAIMVRRQETSLPVG